MKNDKNIYTPEMDEKLDKSSFELVNQGTGAKIHDEKFKTKPTTFAKDAFRRFCKNKSSVVAAIIIGILLLGSIFVPVFSPYSLTNPRAEEAKVLPKLFPTGTGWWDGTTTYSNQLWDRKTASIAGGPDKQPFKEAAILSKSERDGTLTTYSEYAWDGYLYVVSNTGVATGGDVDSVNLLTRNKTRFDLAASDELTVEVSLGAEDNVGDGIIAKEYIFTLNYVDAGTNKTLALHDGYLNLAESYTFNVAEKMNEAGLTDVKSAAFTIKCRAIANDDAKKTYMLVQSVKMASSNDELQATLDQINFYNRTDEEIRQQYLDDPTVTLSDANAVAGYAAITAGVYPIGYWEATGVKDSYGAKIRLFNFVYDNYEHVYGVRDMTIGQSEMQEYIDKGYCRFKKWSVPLDLATEENFNLTKNEFVVLNEGPCPVVNVKSATYSKVSGKGVWQFQCDVTFYKYIGMSKMPTYIFGTDSLGYDLFTRSMNSLKTSLLIAIICVAITFIIGLIWGSICGYFGGTVDLVMERITDILAGMPSIVLMTLFMIKFGRTISTFALSVIITGWIGTASIARTQFYRFRDREYVLASRTLGASDARLIFRHILPNGLGTIITSTVLRIPAFVMSEATLAYLGIGLQTTDSFGVILSTNQKFVQSYPMLIVWPAILISLLMISFNLFGNGLRDAVNPTLKGGE